MINGINFYQNIQIPKMNTTFRGQSQAATNPVTTGNLNEADALASYNSAFINKSGDKFNIPLLKPLQMPTDINSVDGEKIYDSKGILKCIVKETVDKKYIYSSYDKNEMHLDIINKQTGLRELEQMMYTDDDNNVHTKIWSYNKTNGRDEAHADYENGKPMSKSITKHNNDGTKEFIDFLFDDGVYVVARGNHMQNYDINGNLTCEYIHEQRDDGFNKEETNFSDGKPVTTKNKEVRGIVCDEYLNYLKDSNLQRTPCPEFVDNIDNIEGKKTYYSNGQLESVLTADGKLYEQSFNGNCITLTYGNKTIEFENDIGNENKYCRIKEDLGYATKRTSYFDVDNSNEGNVSYTEGNISKFVYFDKNGNPTSYEEFDESKEDYQERLIFGIDFAPNGSVLDVYHSFEEKDN